MKKTLYYFKSGLEKILTNNIFQKTISIISLVLIITVVYKAITLRYKVDKTKLELEEKLETNVKIEHPPINDYEETGAEAISNCLKRPLTENDLTNKMKEISSSLENLFNESNYNFAFKYKDIYTGFSLSYNSNQPIYAASVIKAPEAIYIYDEAEKGNINLEDTLTYTSGYYNEGTGILKNTSFNVDYTIKELVSYSIIHSDNAAHNMLNNKYKSSNMYEYWKELGTTSIFKENSSWGPINANDASIVMEKLYEYYKKDNKYKNDLLDYFNKSWNIITVPNNIPIYNKTGWSDYALHDIALVMDKNPYTLAILTNRGYTDYQDFFNNVSNLIYEYHAEYWNQKMNLCM